MPELRTEIPVETIAVLDGHCFATGKCRTQLVQEILATWASQKLHESTVICRVAGVNPMASDKRGKDV